MSSRSRAPIFPDTGDRTGSTIDELLRQNKRALRNLSRDGRPPRNATRHRHTQQARSKAFPRERAPLVGEGVLERARKARAARERMAAASATAGGQPGTAHDHVPVASVTRAHRAARRRSIDAAPAEAGRAGLGAVAGRGAPSIFEMPDSPRTALQQAVAPAAATAPPPPATGNGSDSPRRGSIFEEDNDEWLAKATQSRAALEAVQTFAESIGGPDAAQEEEEESHGVATAAMENGGSPPSGALARSIFRRRSSADPAAGEKASAAAAAAAATTTPPPTPPTPPADATASLGEASPGEGAAVVGVPATLDLGPPYSGASAEQAPSPGSGSSHGRSAEPGPAVAGPLAAEPSVVGAATSRRDSSPAVQGLRTRSDHERRAKEVRHAWGGSAVQ
eukprot:COSAG01_NODE_2203_length_8173_cov_8.387293_2_plen_393_part_00